MAFKVRLAAIFTGAAIAAATISGQANAVPDDHPLPGAQTADTVANDNPAPAYSFRPDDFCSRTLAEASENVRAVANDTQKFTSVEQWQDTPDASAILTYKLCTATDLDKVVRGSDGVLSDALFRLKDQPWMMDALLPFFRQDYTFLSTYSDRYTSNLRRDIKVSFAGRSDDDRYRRSDGENSEEGEADRIEIDYGLDWLRAAAADRYRQSSIEYRLELLEGLPELPELIQTMIDVNPLITISSRKIKETLTPEQLETVAQMLLQKSADPANSNYFIGQYSAYENLTGAKQMLENAVNASPGKFLYLLWERRSSSLARLAPELTLSPQKFIEAAKNPENARNFLRGFEFYQHLPQAREIAQTAILADSLLFLIDRAEGDLPSLLAADPNLKISAHSLYRYANGDADYYGEGIKSLIMLYDEYAYLPEAQDIVRRAINVSPTSYLSVKAGDRLPEALKDPSYMPTMEQLWAWYGDNGAESRRLYILSYYDAFSDLPGARDFAQKIINDNPLGYYQDESYILSSSADMNADKDLRPSSQALREAAGKYPFDAIGLYPHYAHLPEAPEILQIGVSKSPLYFYEVLSRNREEGLAPQIKALVKQKRLHPPTAQDLYAYMEKSRDDRRDLGDMIAYYPLYSDLPEARDILNKAIEMEPRNAYYTIMRQLDKPDGLRFYIDRYLWEGERGVSYNTRSEDEKGPHWPWPEDARKRELVHYVVSLLIEEHPDDLARWSLDNSVDLLILSGEYEFFRERLLEMADKDPARILRLLSTPDLYDLVDAMDPEFRDALIATMRRPLIEMAQSEDRNFDTEDFGYAMLKGAWPTEHGVFTHQEISLMAQKLVKVRPSTLVQLLDKNPQAVPDEQERTAYVMEAVEHNPFLYLSNVTKEEKTAPLTVAGLNISYDDLLAAGRLYLSGQKELYGGREDIINTLNHLHEYSSEVRFAVMRDAAPGTYSALITLDDQYFYTSTFNYIFDGFLKEIQANPEIRARIWERKGEYNDLVPILNNAMQFGRLDEFLAVLDTGEVNETMKMVLDMIQGKTGDRFAISRRGGGTVTLTTGTEILKAMADRGYGAQIENDLVERFIGELSTDTRMTLGMMAALYSEGREAESHTRFYDKVGEIYLPHLARYMRTDLPIDAMFDEKGRNFQRMVFYDDQDGHATYGHMLEKYRNDGRWKIRDRGKYVSISRGGIELMANKPQFYEEGNAAIDEYVKQQGGVISVLVHRGHSYHVDETAKNFLNPDIRFFWLGSCRSGAVWEYINEAPDMQFIYSSNVGTMLVNDPLLKNINDAMAGGKDVNWLQMREDARRIAHGDKRVDDYVFPDGSLEYALRMAVNLFKTDDDLAKTTQAALLETIYENNISRYTVSAPLSRPLAYGYGMSGPF